MERKFKDSKEKFHKYTGTLLYMAARNEHFQNRIKKSIVKKNILICDRFIDSTIAYQVYGKGVDKKFVNLIHKKILGKIILFRDTQYSTADYQRKYLNV